MVVLDSTIVNIALPSAQQDLGLLDREPPVGRHRLRARVRQPAARRRQARRPLRAQVDLHRRPDRLLGRVVPRRARAVLRRAGGRPRAAGRLRRAARARRRCRCSPSRSRTRPSGPRRSASSPRSRPPARRSACCSAAFLTDALSWRWCLYVNLSSRSRPPSWRCACSSTRRSRTARASTSSASRSPARGLFAIVFGFSKAATDSWTAPVTIVSLAAGVALLTAFVFAERRVPYPLLPLHIVWDRARGGAYASISIAGGERLRRVPVPHVLHAAEPRLLADEDGRRVPADDRADLHRRADAADPGAARGSACGRSS